MSAKVLLVNPSRGFSPPFGILYIAAVLEKNGYLVEIEELNTYGKNSFDFEPLREKIVGHKYDIIGITCLTAYIGIVRYLIQNIKRNNPSILLVVGGTHVTAQPEEVLSIGADIAVIGDGESTFLKIVENQSKGLPLDSIPSLMIRKKSSGAFQYFATAKKTGYEDVNSLPYPAYHLIDLEHYVANNYAIRGYWFRCGWVFTARGCPAACTFCASNITHGHKIRERNINNVVDELEFLKRKYNLEAFWILDDTFVIKENRVISFCEELRKRKLDLTWACQSRVSFFTNNIAKALKESGCVQVDFGVESGSQRVLDALKKGIKVEQTKKAFDIAHKNNLRALATIMIGNPTETWDDIYETKKLLSEIKPDYLGVFFTTPYPGTKLYEQAINNKWINIKNINWTTEGHNDKPLMLINFSEKELNKIYDMLVSRSFVKGILGYLKQKKFFFDLINMVYRDPLFVAKLFFLLISGRKKEFINTFRMYRIRCD